MGDAVVAPPVDLELLAQVLQQVVTEKNTQNSTKLIGQNS